MSSLKPGYKQTDVGVIPEEWVSSSIGEIGTVSSGGTPSRKNSTYWNGSIPWITTAQIESNTIQSAEEFISEHGMKNSAAKLFSSGTLVMAMYGQGKTRGKVAVLGIDATTNQACAAIALQETVSRDYVFHFLVSQYENIRKLSNTGNQENLNSFIIKSIPVPLPPLPEQRAIASVLSDVDAMIAAQDKLIAKKRDMKQAAMQELMTGKRRLPGFSEEWKVQTFGEVFDYLSTATNSRNDLTNDGDAYYIHYGDIHTRFHSHLNFRVVQPPKIKIDRCRNASLLKNGDWIMADASEDFDGIGKSIEIIGLEEVVSAVAGLHTFLLREKSPTFAEGFKGHLGTLKSLHDQFIRVATGLKVYGVSKAALKNLHLPVPPVPEQSAIATILSDMDAEIAELEHKRDKTGMLKQGIMQKLLTGRIRLI